jgi:cytochrome c oxidase subunit 3
LDSPYAAQAQLFFSFYFAMTGTHAFHMVIGIGLMIMLIIQAKNNRFSSEYYAPVEMVGLYWHSDKGRRL